MKHIFRGLILIAMLSCSWFIPQELEKGMLISANFTVSENIYMLNGSDSLNAPVITIEANNSVIDFNNALLTGSNDKHQPNDYYGLAVLIKNSKNLVIRNLKIRGYKVAVRIQNSENVRITDSDFSYNYRPKLYSTREREDISDWLSYHNNDKNEWLRFGAAVYIENSEKIQIDHSTMTGQQNGILMTHSNDGLFYNNDIVFNSGLGIGLYQSNRNRIMHNNLNFNIRGYSHGFYQRGQDSAALLVYEQSSENIIAYNSATHSGDGFFLWAGNTSMKDASGGANNNIVYGNDFSYAPTNGIEITFSKNVIINNFVDEARYGVWGGYSFETIIHNNIFLNSDYGVAIEHGQDNLISNNVIQNTKKAVRLWSRDTDPDWGFAKSKDTRSQNTLVKHNSISKTDLAFEIKNSTDITIAKNNVFDAKEELQDSKSTGTKLIDNISSDESRDEYWNFWLNQVFKEGDDSLSAAYYVQPLIDGKNPFLKYAHLKGRKNMIITEWGPYDFKSPYIHLSSIRSDLYELEILGPPGRWSYYNAKNAILTANKTGDIPDKVVLLKMSEDENIELDLSYHGEEIITEFGSRISESVQTRFNFKRYRQPLPWLVRWYNITGDLSRFTPDNASQYIRFKAEERTDYIEYNWWGAPQKNVNADAFYTKAKTSGFFEKGRYRIGITSDDGIRFSIDGKKVFEDWTIHEPKHDEIIVELNGRHSFELSHYDNSGFASLTFTMEKINED